MQTSTHRLQFTATEVRKTFVSWDRGEAEREWQCLTLLATHAPGVAPRPLHRETTDGAPVVVMERLPGKPLSGTRLMAEQTNSLGHALRRLYAVPLDAIQAANIGERAYGPTTHVEQVAAWLGETYDLSQCRDAHLVADGIDAALGWLAKPANLPEPQLVALGIADLNPANVLWDGATCRLVDFEDGGLSDPAYELADHVEHIAGRLHGTFDADALVAAAGLSPDAHERMRAYQPLWACFWLAMLLPGNGGFRRNPPGTTETQAKYVLSLLG